MPKPIKVLFMARRFPPSVGGMERFAYDLSTSLKNEVTLIPVTWGGSNRWLPLVVPIFFMRAIWTLLTKPGIQIIHMQDAVLAPIGWLLHVIFNKPFVVIAHGLDITYKKAFYQNLIIPFVRKADKVISISSATNQEVVTRGIDVLKTEIITIGAHDYHPNGVRSDKHILTEQLGIELDDRLLLLTTGRLVRRKGVEWFVSNVMPEVVKSNPEVVYLVVGEGVERQSIENAIAKNGLNENVRLLGRVSDHVRQLLYQSSDIFVMPNIVVPSDMEGFGIVVQEAAVAGLPVVASDLEGIKDAIVNGKNGIMVPSQDKARFVREIRALTDSPAKRRQLGVLARDFTLKEYGWDVVAKKYRVMYQKLLVNKS